MIQFTFRVRPSIKKRAQKKAGLLGLSRYIRTLIGMWISGEIKVSEADIIRHGG